jgi:preprotein translocase subunit SecD
MNRYPVWKYVIIAIALVVAGLYALPNVFGESPAVQVSPAKSMVKIDAALQSRVEEALKAAGMTPDGITRDANSLKLRLASSDLQLKVKDLLQKALVTEPTSPDYVVALNLLSRSPAWLSALHAAPMYLGLDLRGGVHFMLQVDMQAALTKRAESLSGDLRTSLREKNIRHSGIARDGQTITVR